MKIDGRWAQDADGDERPVFDGILVTPDGQQIAIEVLLDTGADSLVLAPTIAQQLGTTVQPIADTATASGIGGMIPLFNLEADLLLFATTGQRIRIRGPLPIILNTTTLDRSVLGRNVTNQFTVVCSRPDNLVALLSPPDTILLK
jgi:predicted aspartyl protease